MPSKRISFFIQHYPPYLGGAEMQARTLAEALVRRGHEVQVFTTRFRHDLHCVSADDSLRIRRLPTLGPRALKLPVNFLTGLWAGLYLARGSDVLHGHCLSPFTLGALIGARWRRRPLLIKIGSTGSRGDVAKILNEGIGTYLWKLFLQSELFIAPTQPVAAELASQGAQLDQVTVVPNILSHQNAAGVEEKPAGRRRLGLPERLTVLFVGRLSPEKGLDRLLRAWPEVVAQLDAQLVLVGEGPQREAIEHTIEVLGLGNSVILTGYKPDPAPYYDAADLFAFPSYSETFGNVIVEAMSHELPVLSTTVGVVKQWPLDAPIERFDGDDPSVLSGRLIHLLEGLGLRSELGQQARAFISERYPVDEICARYEKIYDGLRYRSAGES